MFDELKAIKKEYDEHWDVLEKRTESALSAALNAFLEKYPEVRGVAWAQYSPQYRDGDGEFSVDTVVIATDNDAALAGEEGVAVADLVESWYHELSDVPRPTPLKEDYEALGKSIRGIQQFLAPLFGDGVLVVATRDGYTIRKWDSWAY